MSSPVSFSLVFLLLASLAVSAVPRVCIVSGPETSNMQIQFLSSTDDVNKDLQDGYVDINDWPLSKKWIDGWVQNPSIQLRDYVAYDMFQFDLNNQRWPTGAGNETFYNPTNPRHVAARHFRRALAYLTNKDNIVSNILKGLGYRMDSCLPKPLADVYLGNVTWGVDIKKYDYNEAEAVHELVMGNFRDWDLDGVVEWSPTNSSLDIEELPSLDFIIRCDDPFRRQVGKLLGDRMGNIPRYGPSGKLPGVMRISHETWETDSGFMLGVAMGDYHIFTGYWRLGMDPDYLYDFWGSYSYFLELLCEYPVSDSPSYNYVGFCNYQYDYWAERVKYNSGASLTYCIQQAVKVLADQAGIIPLWSSAAVKAFGTGWTSVVNNFGYGIDNWYTFFSMKHITEERLYWGFAEYIENLNAISSRRFSDWNVLNLIYDSMMGRNPFTQALDQYFLADDHVVTTWTDGAKTMTKLCFHIPGTSKWQDSTNATPRYVTVDDVVFSLNFTKACVPMQAWNWPKVKDINYTGIAVGPIPGKINDGKWVEVKENVLSIFALDWLATLPILPRHIWEPEFPFWNKWHPDFFYMCVIWQPWSEAHPTVAGLTKCIGSGPWIFKEWSLQAVILEANTQFYLTPTEVKQRIAKMFHANGNVNCQGAVNAYPSLDTLVNVLDVGYLAKAFGQSGANTGTGWGQMNTDADFNGDNAVNAADYTIVHKSYGKSSG